MTHWQKDRHCNRSSLQAFVQVWELNLDLDRLFGSTGLPGTECRKENHWLDCSQSDRIPGGMLCPLQVIVGHCGRETQKENTSWWKGAKG